jgi:hypothetical protein
MPSFNKAFQKVTSGTLSSVTGSGKDQSKTGPTNWSLPSASTLTGSISNLPGIRSASSEPEVQVKQPVPVPQALGTHSPITLQPSLQTAPLQSDIPSDQPNPAPDPSLNDNIPASGVVSNHEIGSEPTLTVGSTETPIQSSPSLNEPAQSPRPQPESKTSSISLWGRSKPKTNRSDDTVTDDATSPAPVKSSDSQFKIKMPKALRSFANLEELDIDLAGGEINIVSDNKKLERKPGLCGACSKINFEQFDSSTDQSQSYGEDHLSRKLLFLDRLLRKHKKSSCRFCCLLFDAIAQNDPLQHPAVKDHLPKQLVGMTFRQWAEDQKWTQNVPGLKSNYPFGQSRDSVDLKQDVQGDAVVVNSTNNDEQLTTDDAAKGASLAAVTGLNVAMWNETDTERVKIMASVGTIIPTLTSIMTNLQAKLPVAISIILHNSSDINAGLLNVDVWGYGGRHRAPLARLSTFNLRIASNYQATLGGGLRYGKVSCSSNVFDIRTHLTFLAAAT